MPFFVIGGVVLPLRRRLVELNTIRSMRGKQLQFIWPDHQNPYANEGVDEVQR